MLIASCNEILVPCKQRRLFLQRVVACKDVTNTLSSIERPKMLHQEWININALVTSLQLFIPIIVGVFVTPRRLGGIERRPYPGGSAAENRQCLRPRTYFIHSVSYHKYSSHSVIRYSLYLMNHLRCCYVMLFRIYKYNIYGLLVLNRVIISDGFNGSVSCVQVCKVLQLLWPSLSCVGFRLRRLRLHIFFS